MIGTQSLQSGIRASLSADAIDTVFKSYFGCNGVKRLYCVDVGQVEAVANTHFPQWDTLLLLGNTSQYGGAGYPTLGTFTLHDDAIQVAVHELGHAFAGLADEYDYGGSTPPSHEPVAPNITINRDENNLKWKH